jgi:UDP-N-acetyl-2-amino-2-deoxyglucuronate dehydrogenase
VKEETIKFAIIGCGHIGKRHAAMIEQHPEAEVVALCDIKPKEKLDLAGFSHLPFYNSINALLKNHPESRVINICTPNALHADQALIALQANKSVVIEKPMDISSEKCREVIEESRRMNKQVFCVMQNRYSPPSVWLKNIMEEKRLGKIYMVQINCFWNRDERYYHKHTWKGTKKLDGGTLFTQFSHFIDMMFWLFGDIKNIRSTFHNFSHKDLTEFEDSGFINFDFVKEGTGSFNFTTSVYEKNLESSITIIGEKGTVKVGGQYMNEVVYCNIKGYTMPELAPSNPPNDYGCYKGSAANHHFIIENVVDTLKGRSRATTTAEEGMQVVDMIERMVKAGKKHLLPF